MVDQKKKSEFAEPLFYTFLEKWLQIKCSMTMHGGISNKIFVVDVDMINETLSQKFQLDIFHFY